MADDAANAIEKEPASLDGLRTAIALGSFGVMIAGVALLSVPWSMILGGGLLLAAAIYGQFRQPPKGNK